MAKFADKVLLDQKDNIEQGGSSCHFKKISHNWAQELNDLKDKQNALE